MVSSLSRSGQIHYATNLIIQNIDINIDYKNIYSFKALAGTPVCAPQVENLQRKLWIDINIKANVHIHRLLDYPIVKSSAHG